MNVLSSRLGDGVIFEAYDGLRQVRVKSYGDQTLGEPYLTVSVSRLDAATRDVIELDVDGVEALMLALGAWLHRRRTDSR